MAKKSTRTADKEKDEYTFMWGLFGILRSCQVLTANPNDHSTRLENNASKIVKTKQSAKMNSKPVDSPVKTHKKARKNSQTASNSAHECFQRSIHRAKKDQARAKAFADQKFIASLIRKQGKNSEPNSFTDALQALNLNKDMLMDRLPESNSFPTRHGKNVRHSQTEEGIIVLKPGIRYTKRSENVTCHCSSNRTVSDAQWTSFSFRGMKKRLKHTFEGTGREGTFDDRIRHGVNARRSCKKVEGLSYCKKAEFDVVREAKRHLSARLRNVRDAETARNEKRSRTLSQILASPEHDSWPRDSQHCSYNTSDGRKKTSLNDQSTGSEVHGTDRKSNSKSYAEMSNRTTDITLHTDDENGSLLQYLPSSPPSVSQLDADDRDKFQEHQSPVSVLELLFAEDANSPQSSTRETGKLHLDFEERSLKHINTSSDTEELDQVCEYVHSVLQASCLNWDQLLETRCASEDLLRASLFDEVQFLRRDCRFDPRLLFNLINEVLLSINRSHFCFPPRIPSVKPKIMSAPLQELVLDKIMTEADLYLLPWTKTRSLEEIVASDMANCRSWLDVRFDTEEIAVMISEEFLVECILETIA